MPDIKQDLLGLQYSQNFEIQGLQEADINLELPPAPSTFATVYGVVSDGTTPIADATVKLFDDAGLPYKHTLTDAKGAFSISDIPAGTYSLAAVKEGYRPVSYTHLEYDELTNMIINRAGDGPCPMEQTVAQIEDPNEAFEAIKQTLKRLRSEKKQ